VELNRTMVDFALFVTTHELLHLLGAKDKYDAAGRSLVPEGGGAGAASALSAASRRSDGAQCRARPHEERAPESLADLVGAATRAKWLGAVA
jgi:hypothetical protein